MEFTFLESGEAGPTPARRLDLQFRTGSEPSSGWRRSHTKQDASSADLDRCTGSDAEHCVQRASAENACRERYNTNPAPSRLIGSAVDAERSRDQRQTDDDPQEAIDISVKLAKDLNATWLNIDMIMDDNGNFLITEFSPVWHHYAYKEKPSFVYKDDYNIDVPLEVSLDLERIIVESLIEAVKKEKEIN